MDHQELPINERWLMVDGYISHSVSNCGRIRNDVTGRILRCSINSNGYVTVGLYRNGRKKTLKLHRLVAKEWVDNIGGDDHNQVDHIDHNKTNNHINNLRWVTGSINARNKSKRITNTSGKQGVCQAKRGNSNYWIVSICNNERATIIKYFSIDKLGNDVAYARAVQCRKDLERQYGYIGA